MRTAFWLYQPYMEAAGVPLGLFGVGYAVLALSAAAVSGSADVIERRAGEKAVLAGMPLLSCLGFVCMGILPLAGAAPAAGASGAAHATAAPALFALSFLFLHQFAFGLHDPVLRNYANAEVPSATRATVLAVASLGGNLCYGLVAPFIGALVDGIGLPAACRCLAGLTIIGAAALAVAYRRHATRRGTPAQG